jgi:hypothetical protein
MTLDEYIIESAVRGADESFLRKFSNAEIFFSIQSHDLSKLEGPIDVPAGADLRLQLAKLDIGQMGLFYASKSDSRLGEKFAGMPLARAVKMVCDLPSIDGMLIQSSSDAWFVARSETLRGVVGQVRDSVLYKEFT